MILRLEGIGFVRNRDLDKTIIHVERRSVSYWVYDLEAGNSETFEGEEKESQT